LEKPCEPAAGRALCLAAAGAAAGAAGAAAALPFALAAVLESPDAFFESST